MTTTASKIVIELDSDALDTLYRVATCASKKRRFGGDPTVGVRLNARRGRVLAVATTGKVAALAVLPGVEVGEEERWDVLLETGPLLKLKSRKSVSRQGFFEVFCEGGDPRQFTAYVGDGTTTRTVSVLGDGGIDLTCLLPSSGEEPVKELGDLLLNPDLFATAFYAVANKPFDPNDSDAAVKWCQYTAGGPIWITCKARPHMVAVVMPVVPEGGTTIAGVPEELLADLRS